MKKTQRSFGELNINTISVLPKTQNNTDIILIHMSWGGTWAFTLYMPFLASYGYRVHALDLRGHGDSGGTVRGTTMQDYVDDVKTVVDGLGLSTPIVIGHSMGGLIALMYASQYGSSALISMDGSPSLEVQKTSEEKTYPESYTPKDSGMPGNPIAAMMALPDVPLMRLMKMKKMLDVESGVARSDRKKGVSVPKESLQMPLLFIGAEKGTSVPFGIGIEKTQAQANYYEGDLVEIKKATHPGLLVGRKWKVAAKVIVDWLGEQNI